MRALTHEEVEVLQDFSLGAGHDIWTDADEDPDEPVVARLIVRGCVAEVPSCDPEYEVDRVITPLGRLALRVALPHMAVL